MTWSQDLLLANVNFTSVPIQAFAYDEPKHGLTPHRAEATAYHDE